MSGVSRRSFLQLAGTLVPAVLLPGCAETDAAAADAGDPLDAALLTPLAEAVLPSELGPSGRARAVSGFQSWLAAFEPVAELNHGYGTGELEYTSADPAPGWQAQLRALDLEAQRRHGAGFAQLAPEVRRDLIRQHLSRDRAERLPDAAEARHVAVGLLAYFYATPEATDLCYGAAIRKNACRPLSTSGQRPTPLQGA